MSPAQIYLALLSSSGIFVGISSFRRGSDFPTTPLLERLLVQFLSSGIMLALVLSIYPLIKLLDLFLLFITQRLAHTTNKCIHE